MSKRDESCVEILNNGFKPNYIMSQEEEKLIEEFKKTSEGKYYSEVGYKMWHRDILKAFRSGKLAGFEEVEQERKYLQIGISNCVPSDEYRKGAERMNFQMKVFLNEKLGSKDIVCTFCNGTGAYKGKLKYAYCPGCQGTGKV